MTDKPIDSARKKLYLTIVFLSLSSLSIAFIPLGNFDGTTGGRVIAYMIGGIFWLFLIAGYIIFRIAVKQCSKALKKKKDKNGIKRYIPFLNSKARIVDIACIGSLAAAIVLSCFDEAKDFSYIFYSAFFATIQIHFVLCGRTYRIATKKATRRVENA